MINCLLMTGLAINIDSHDKHIDHEVEEERRILYVALTRAENELILMLTGDAGRNTFFGGSGLADEDHIYYFLSEIPDQLVDHQYIQCDDFGSFLEGLEGFE